MQRTDEPLNSLHVIYDVCSCLIFEMGGEKKGLNTAGDFCQSSRAGVPSNQFVSKELLKQQ